MSTTTSCPDYTANNTASTTTLFTNCTISLCEGECVKITACNRLSSYFGDTYLRLYNNESIQVCENDDDANNECGETVSAIKFYRADPGCADYVLRQGCTLDTFCTAGFDYEITADCADTGFADCDFVEDTTVGQELNPPDGTYLWIVLACVAFCVLVPFLYWVQQPLNDIFYYTPPPLPPVKQRKTRAAKNANANELGFDDVLSAEGVEMGSVASGGSVPIGTRTEASRRSGQGGDGFNQLQLTEF
jgi:hypothetical protein